MYDVHYDTLLDLNINYTQKKISGLSFSNLVNKFLHELYGLKLY